MKPKRIKGGMQFYNDDGSVSVTNWDQGVDIIDGSEESINKRTGNKNWRCFITKEQIEDMLNGRVAIIWVDDEMYELVLYIGDDPLSQKVKDNEH